MTWNEKFRVMVLFLLLGTHVCPASIFKCWKCENNCATMEKMVLPNHCKWM